MTGIRILAQAIARGGDFGASTDKYIFEPDDIGVLEWRYVENRQDLLSIFIIWDKDPQKKLRPVEFARLEVIGLELKDHSRILTIQGH